MKRIVTSNWGQLRRALCILFIGVAALWAVPRNARAQLYVSQFNGSVGEYDATTGAVPNANFISKPSVGLAGLPVSPVPEPSAWSMIGVGSVALFGIMLRKKHRIA